MDILIKKTVGNSGLSTVRALVHPVLASNGSVPSLCLVVLFAWGWRREIRNALYLIDTSCFLLTHLPGQVYHTESPLSPGLSNTDGSQIDKIVQWSAMLIVLVTVLEQ